MPPIKGFSTELLQAAHQAALDALRPFPPNTLLALEHLPPLHFWSYLIAGLQTQKAIALLPEGLAPERYQAYLEHLKPTLLIKKDLSLHSLPYPKNQISLEGKILISTGGSGGKIKFAYHSWQSLSEGVLALEEHLSSTNSNGHASSLKPNRELIPLHSFTSLPLYHVSGLMPGVRAAVTKGSVFYTDSKTLLHALAENFAQDRWVSLVPTQLTAILENTLATQNLQKAKGIFLGAAQAPQELLERAQTMELPIYLTYGMTETAGMVTLSSALNFKNNHFHLGKPLPGVSMSNTKEGLAIEARSICQGYFPEAPKTHSSWIVQDEAFWDAEGHLERIERKDRFIMSGGLKIDPRWVEKLLLETNALNEAFVFGESDAYWGAIAIACIVPKNLDSFHLDSFREAFKTNLETRYHPKEWITLKALPRLENGKLNIVAIKSSLDRSKK